MRIIYTPPGRWNMILSVSDKGKQKNTRILLDRLFSPEPGRYRFADLQVNITEKNLDNASYAETTNDEDLEDDFESYLISMKDSLDKSGIDGKVHLLPEVTVRAKRNSREEDIRRSRSTSAIYYDVASESDDIYDKGIYVGDDIHQLLLNMNNDFSLVRITAEDDDCSDCDEWEKIKKSKYSLYAL